MNGWEALNIARETPGVRIAAKRWNRESYLYFEHGHLYKDDGSICSGVNMMIFSKYEWEVIETLSSLEQCE